MATSTITISVAGFPPGAPISIPMGTDINIAINSAPDELVAIGLRLKPPDATFHPSFRTVSPPNADGSQAYGLSHTSFYPAGEITVLNANTFNLLPGNYQFVSLVYDPHHISDDGSGAVEFISSNSFEIVAGFSDDLLPAGSPFANVGAWMDAIANDMTGPAPRIMALYGAAGDALNTVHTGDLVILAVNTTGMTEVLNKVEFHLDMGGGAEEIILLEVFPFPEFINDGDWLSIAAIPAPGLNMGTRLKLFYVPGHQTYTQQQGQLRLALSYRNPADQLLSVPVTLTDDPVIVLNNNSHIDAAGNPVPHQRKKITVATIGADYPEAHYDAYAQELSDFFQFACRDYFAIEVTIHNYRLSDFPIDYAGWWSGLPKVPEGAVLDPMNPDDMFFIQLIYAHEHNMVNQPSLESLHPLQADGEDITLYMLMQFSGGGGAAQNACEIQTRFTAGLMSQDYKVDGNYQAPSEMNDPAAIWDTPAKRAVEVNICAHEIGHAFWKRPVRRDIGHANAYHMHEAQYGGGRFYRFIRYLDAENAVDAYNARVAIGWGNTLMSYSRNRNNLDQRLLLDQLGPLIPLYAPPELSFLVKAVGAPVGTAGPTITINAGDSVELVLQGSSPSGLRMMWWFEQGAPAVSTMYTYGHIDSYQRIYEALEIELVTFDDPGVYVLQSNCRDILYYIAHGGTQSNADTRGNPHQASENVGLRAVTITVN